mmetsp:Transcript_26921/g.77643  ORF Transcript_26921/g.77643 Transcript_26921/m.77643 type:complete len:226 (-) Transcript_26921:111-788(-)
MCGSFLSGSGGRSTRRKASRSRSDSARRPYSLPGGQTSCPVPAVGLAESSRYRSGASTIRRSSPWTSSRVRKATVQLWKEALDRKLASPPLRLLWLLLLLLPLLLLLLWPLPLPRSLPWPRFPIRQPPPSMSSTSRERLTGWPTSLRDGTPARACSFRLAGRSSVIRRRSMSDIDSSMAASSLPPPPSLPPGPPDMPAAAAAAELSASSPVSMHVSPLWALLVLV